MFFPSDHHLARYTQILPAPQETYVSHNKVLYRLAGTYEIPAQTRTEAIRLIVKAIVDTLRTLFIALLSAETRANFRGKRFEQIYVRENPPIVNEKIDHISQLSDRVTALTKEKAQLEASACCKINGKPDHKLTQLLRDQIQNPTSKGSIVVEISLANGSYEKLEWFISYNSVLGKFVSCLIPTTTQEGTLFEYQVIDTKKKETQTMSQLPSIKRDPNWHAVSNTSALTTLSQTSTPSHSWFLIEPRAEMAGDKEFSITRGEIVPCLDASSAWFMNTEVPYKVTIPDVGSFTLQIDHPAVAVS